MLTAKLSPLSPLGPLIVKHHPSLTDFDRFRNPDSHSGKLKTDDFYLHFINGMIYYSDRASQLASIERKYMCETHFRQTVRRIMQSCIRGMNVLAPYLIFLFLFLITEPLLSLKQLPGCVWERSPGFCKSLILFLCGIPLQALLFGLIFLLPCKLCLVCLSCLIIVYNIYFFTDFFLYFTQNQIINPDMLAVMAGTNWQEITNFAVIYKWSAMLLALYVIALLSFLVFYCIKASWHFSFKKRFFVFLLCLLPMVVLFVCNAKDVQTRRFGFLVYQPSALSYLQVIMKQNNLRNINEQIAKNKKELRFDFPEHVTGIVVVGESASRCFMECYGYSKATTPYMSSSDWIIYKDVVTASPYTHMSTHFMFTDKRVNGGDATLAIPALLANDKNCYVSYTSNQPCGMFDAIRPLFSGSNSYKPLRNDSATRNCADHELLNYVPLQDTGNKTKVLHIIHLAGSHFPYSHSYPAEFCKFGAADEINHYENSILYTDFVLNELIQQIKDEQEPIWVLYLSDHGESPGGTMRNVTEYSVWEIPFAFYINDAYKKQFPGMYEKIKSHANVPFTNDCVFEIIMHLLGISYDGFDSGRIPFSDNYRPVRRFPGSLPDRHPSEAK